MGTIQPTSSAYRRRPVERDRVPGAPLSGPVGLGDVPVPPRIAAEDLLEGVGEFGGQVALLSWGGVVLDEQHVLDGQDAVGEPVATDPAG